MTKLVELQLEVAKYVSVSNEIWDKAFCREVGHPHLPAQLK